MKRWLLVLCLATSLLIADEQSDAEYARDVATQQQINAMTGYSAVETKYSEVYQLRQQTVNIVNNVADFDFKQSLTQMMFALAPGAIFNSVISAQYQALVDIYDGCVLFEWGAADLFLELWVAAEANFVSAESEFSQANDSTCLSLFSLFGLETELNFIIGLATGT